MIRTENWNPITALAVDLELRHFLKKVLCKSTSISRSFALFKMSLHFVENVNNDETR